MPKYKYSFNFRTESYEDNLYNTRLGQVSFYKKLENVSCEYDRLNG